MEGGGAKVPTADLISLTPKNGELSKIVMFCTIFVIQSPWFVYIAIYVTNETMNYTQLLLVMASPFCMSRLLT